LEHVGIINLLHTLNSDDFKQALQQQPGYDIRETGVIQYDSE
jgi:hypothetical protein